MSVMRSEDVKPHFQFIFDRNFHYLHFPIANAAMGTIFGLSRLF
jgi:hypothetical protein